MINLRTFRLLALLLVVFMSFASPLPAQPEEPNVAGLWDAVVILDQAEVPFRFEIVQTGTQAQGSFFEGRKRITSTSGEFVGGRLQLEYEFLNATLTATFDGETFQGSYKYHRKNGREYGFRARRFAPPPPEQAADPQIAGNWEMKLVGEDSRPGREGRAPQSWKLYLRQSGPEVSGSILRVDGDTGTLSGLWHADGTLVLSHFAGERPVLLEAKLQPDGTLDITLNRLNKYLAAKTNEARAKGIPDPPDPSRYTSVKDPSEPFHFSFLDVNGKTVSDAQFKGKVMILSIGGTWCPNCRDEAPFLVGLYKKFHSKGLEIVGLNFEASGDPAEDTPRIASFIKEFQVPYPVLLAGAIPDVKDKLPQLVNFGAYPTTIYLGRDGRVASVHAGFASAATGDEHLRLQSEVRTLVQRLLAQKGSSSDAPGQRKSSTSASLQ